MFDIKDDEERGARERKREREREKMAGNKVL